MAAFIVDWLYCGHILLRANRDPRQFQHAVDCVDCHLGLASCTKRCVANCHGLRQERGHLVTHGLEHEVDRRFVGASPAFVRPYHFLIKENTTVDVDFSGQRCKPCCIHSAALAACVEVLAIVAVVIYRVWYKRAARELEIGLGVAVVVDSFHAPPFVLGEVQFCDWCVETRKVLVIDFCNWILVPRGEINNEF